MKWFDKFKIPISGFTLLEVLISIFILSIVIASSSVAFVIATKGTRNNEIRMTAMNLANERIEYVRSLTFAEVGTKYKGSEGNYISGDPAGDILHEEVLSSNGMKFKLTTTINWEEQSDWDLAGDAEWDYKSVKVTVTPQGFGDADKLTQSIETLVTRDSTQTLLLGSNIRTRFVRGWIHDVSQKIPVPNVKVMLTEGPSAVRYSNASSKGIASFIDLSPGDYTVKYDPSFAGMIMEPKVSKEQKIVLEEGNTVSKEYNVEYPCTIRMSLKNLTGNPIVMNSDDIGELTIQSPYELIDKTFRASDLNADGRLPDHFLSGIWPLGDGYAGTYDITSVYVPGYQYIDSYSGNGLAETVWNGQFEEPGITKNITSYFIEFPEVPGSAGTDWVNSERRIREGSFTIDGDGVFRTSYPTQTIIMTSSHSSEFNGRRIFFANTGNATYSGLTIGSNSNLILNASEVIFQGKIRINGSESSVGKIHLTTTWEDGTQVGSIVGDSIGAEEGIYYGKLYLKEPLYIGESETISPGGYYFPEGIKLPSEISRLVPFTKDNYVD